MNPLKELLELAQQREDVERRIIDAVAAARAEGTSWQAIANMIGGTKQAAQQRYGKAAPATVPQLVPAASKKVDAPAPAKPKAARITDAQLVEEAKVILANIAAKTASKKVDAPAPANVADLDERPEFVLRSAGTVDGVAQPGTGKGPHQCPRCGSTNHKSGNPDTIRAYLDCKPTKYDPQDIAHHLNTTGLSK